MKVGVMLSSKMVVDMSCLEYKAQWINLKDLSEEMFDFFKYAFYNSADNHDIHNYAVFWS